MTKQPGKKRAKAPKRNTRKAGAKKKSGAAKRRAPPKAVAKKRSHKRAVQAIDRIASSTSYADLFADHLIRSAPTYASLQERLTTFLLADFSAVVNNPQLNAAVPSEFTTNPNNLDVSCQRLRSNFQNDPSWGVDAARFTLDGGRLLDAIKAYDAQHAADHRTATFGWLLSLIYHYVLAARRRNAA
ncbi:hypothetical protein [Bradyrhizobium genosp. P]|uniref:hypothetical protein n=1 Tax=Bradyrhizobium genosp. P TaxID=83641 RepID=UPI003CF6306A